MSLYIHKHFLLFKAIDLDQNMIWIQFNMNAIFILFFHTRWGIIGKWAC